MALPKDMTFYSFLPPVLVRTHRNETYVCPGWHLVPNNTTLEEVQERWTQHIPKGKPEQTKQISETVISSNGKSGYLVEFDGRYWSCSCPGFGFRRNCRHINEMQLKHT